MSRLILLRHAQASFSSDLSAAFVDYDRLSKLGERQSEVLGEELAESTVVFDRVFVGPSRRHLQTLELVGAAYEQRSLPWPEPETLPALKEHQGSRVVRRALANPGFDPELIRLAEQFESAAEEGEARQRLYFMAFRHVTLRWARQDLPADIAEGESWQAFRDRVSGGVQGILGGGRAQETVAVFTSGGPVIGIGDDRVGWLHGAGRSPLGEIRRLWG